MAVVPILHKSLMEGELPFEIRQPRYNAETEAAMQEARDIANGKIKAKRYSSTAELRKDLNVKGDLQSIITHDKGLKRTKQIDLQHIHKGIKPHTHEGYIHDEKGTHRLTVREKKLVALVLRIWDNNNNK